MRSRSLGTWCCVLPEALPSFGAGLVPRVALLQRAVTYQLAGVRHGKVSRDRGRVWRVSRCDAGPPLVATWCELRLSAVFPGPPLCLDRKGVLLCSWGPLRACVCWFSGSRSAGNFVVGEAHSAADHPACRGGVPQNPATASVSVWLQGLEVRAVGAQRRPCRLDAKGYQGAPFPSPPTAPSTSDRFERQPSRTRSPAWAAPMWRTGQSQIPTARCSRGLLADPCMRIEGGTTS